MPRCRQKNAESDFVALITTLVITAQAKVASDINIAEQSGLITALFNRQPYRVDDNPYHRKDIMLARIYCRAWLMTINPGMCQYQIEKCLDELHPWGGNHG